MRSQATLALGLAMVLLAGCTSIEYGPLGGKERASYAYREQLTSPGHYILAIVGYGGDPATVHSSWDRRAAELCGGTQYVKTLYRAERPTVRYDFRGGRPGVMELEGFLDCGADTASAHPTAPGN